MRRFTLAVIVLLSLGACAGAVQAPPRTSVSVSWSVFYDSLTPYGDWVWLNAHGWVWIPSGMDPTWQPYSYGRWVYTVDGWTWISYWPWGWAPFHYGRWAWHTHWGWYWVPDTVWGPAWVAWRYGDPWVGWAPLPPGATWSVSVGLTLGNVRIAPSAWLFVPRERFLDHDVRSRIIPPDNRRRVYDRTRDVTRYEPGDRRQVIERGLPPGQIERDTKVKVPRYRIEDVQKPTPPGDAVGRDEIRIYRPPIVKAAPSKEPPPKPAKEAKPKKEKKAKPAKPDKSAKPTRPPGF